MKIGKSTLTLLGLIVAVLSGCSRDGNVKSGISKLEEAFPAARAAASAGGDSAAESAASQIDVNAYVGQAVSSLQHNDHVGAVTILNAVQAQTNLTAQQHMAVHESIQKVYADLVARAARGDAKAKASLVQLEKKLSQ
jgi:hypothetical protein